jgi:hypothetical protein
METLQKTMSDMENNEFFINPDWSKNDPVYNRP